MSIASKIAHVMCALMLRQWHQLGRMGLRFQVLPAVVVYEIRCGLLRMQRKAQLEAFERMAAVCHVLEVDAEVARHAADIRWALESAGTPIGLHDVLVAATARRYQHTLVTHNTREFSRVPDLRIDDWY